MTDRRIDPLTGAQVRVVAERQDRPNQPRVEDCPFCVGGLEAPDPYTVKAFPNRWPPMPDERCEIVLYTPDHDASGWLCEPNDLVALTELMRRTVTAGAAQLSSMGAAARARVEQEYSSSGFVEHVTAQLERWLGALPHE